MVDHRMLAQELKAKQQLHGRLFASDLQMLNGPLNRVR